ncbi:MAG: M20/M25/M40 family metallo-hydrolase [Gemmatimonadota bacterium]|nr:M20/M25/M40 family metallo-hydrolase [Gemmatimonadota bacterium]
MKRSLVVPAGVLALVAACARGPAPNDAPASVAAAAPARSRTPPGCSRIPGPYPAMQFGPPASQNPPQLPVVVARDSAVIASMIREGIGASHVAADLQHLTDVIGPRLTGTAELRRANDWTQSKFREYGMDSTWQEGWGFGCAWTRGPMSIRMIAPQSRWLIGESWAWSPGTDGVARGPVVFVDAKTRDDFAQRFAGKLRGAWVMTSPAFPIINPDGPKPNAVDSVGRLKSIQALFAQPQNEAERDFRQRRTELLHGEGIAGLVLDASKEEALLNMSGSPRAVSPVPQIVVPHETFTQFQRLAAAGQPAIVEVSISNEFSAAPVTAYNTIAELRGSERPDEVVLLGAHLDSWDLGTGTTDNGTGSIAVLEAARILRASGARPRRTIRFALFSGEEEGLFGSQEYAKAHAGELPKFQAVTVLDNGTGRVTGMALQGRDELSDLWTSLFSPLSALGGFVVRRGNKGGTDHLSFLPYGVPGFNFDQESRGYDHTHHSQVDTFDHAVIEDIQQAATVMAATAYELANLKELLPRNEKRESKP